MMLSSIRRRLLIIGGLLVASAWALFPRAITTQVAGPNGSVRDSVERRIPLKYGLDLQGGMHLELELDQSKQVSSDPKRDIDLALTVLRKRIDQFGVTEPVIQKQGDSRIVVERAGITNPARAREIVQTAAFLEFRLTDKTHALEKAIPSIDRALRGLGVKGGEGAAPASAVQQLLGGTDTSQRADTSGKAAAGKGGAAAKAGAGKDTAAADTSDLGGVLASLIQPTNDIPGEYIVKETAYPRVDSILHLPEVAKLLPRGVDLRWAGSPVSILSSL